mgnify:CR=1 FL=1
MLFRSDQTKRRDAGIKPFTVMSCDNIPHNGVVARNAVAGVARLYDKGLAEPCLLSLRDGGWLAADALIVVEEAADAEFSPPPGFAEVERRAFGDTQLIFLRSQ